MPPALGPSPPVDQSLREPSAASCARRYGRGGGAVDHGAGWPPASMVPVAYRRCGQTRLFEVVLESRGPEGVAFWLDLIATYVLSDDQGPLDSS